MRRVLVFDAVFGSRVCKECGVPSLWLVLGSPSGPLIGCHWPLTCVRDQAAPAGGGDNQSWSEYSVQSLTPMLGSESQLYPAQTLSCVLKASSPQHPGRQCSGEKECSAQESNFGSSGSGVTPHSRITRVQTLLGQVGRNFSSFLINFVLGSSKYWWNNLIFGFKSVSVIC